MWRTVALLGLGALLGGAAADAAVCSSPRQMKLIWSAARKEGVLVFGANECPGPAACAAAKVPSGTALVKAPMTLSIRGASGPVFEATLPACERDACVSNSGGCPGGADSVRGAAGVVKVIYSRQNRASLMARLRAPMPQAPEAEGPVTVTLADATGYSSEATFRTCTRTMRESDVTMVCR